MSNAFAIAAVTAALKAALRNALAAPGLDAALGGPPTVSAIPPDRINAAGGADPNVLNVFLYAVSSNTGWSNTQLPSRDAHGERVASPPLSLDLQYLLTAFAATDYGAEILLGHGMQALHEAPFFTRQWLRDVLKSNPPANDIPAVLETTGLAEQIEQIRITPKPLSLDEISKVWTALQGRYRPTAAYLVTVVLIEARRSARAPLPVLERRVRAGPGHQPRLDDAVNASGESLPITAGATLRLRGAGLGQLGIQAWIGGINLSAAIVNRGETALDVALPDPLPAGLRAGLVPAQVVQPMADMGGLPSNAVGFLLRPTLGAPTFAAGAITVPFAPPVTARQRAVLMLNERQPPAGRRTRAYSFLAPLANGIAGPATEASSIAFPVPHVTPGTYLVRLQVDGAESLVATDAQGRFDAPKVTIP
jgi:hypothetical protein